MDYKQLKVWIRAMDLAVDIYRATEVLPKEERYALTLQMRKAAGSVPNNIAEGEGRYTLRDQLAFYARARGSLYEVETQTILCGRVDYFDSSPLIPTIDETARLLNGTIRALDRRARMTRD